MRPSSWNPSRASVRACPARPASAAAKRPKRGLSREQIPILVARDRTGQTTDAVLPSLSRAAVTAALDGVVGADNQLCCDGGKAIACSILPKPGGPRPEAPNLHINNVNVTPKHPLSTAALSC